MIVATEACEVAERISLTLSAKSDKLHQSLTKTSQHLLKGILSIFCLLLLQIFFSQPFTKAYSASQVLFWPSRVSIHVITVEMNMKVQRFETNWRKVIHHSKHVIFWAVVMSSCSEQHESELQSHGLHVVTVAFSLCQEFLYFSIFFNFRGTKIFLN